MAEYSRAAAPLRPERGEKIGGIKLERVGRARRDVGSGPHVVDLPAQVDGAGAEQQAADLNGRGGLGMGSYLPEQRSCNPGAHRHIRYRMNRGVSIIDAVVPADADGWRLDRALAAAVPVLSRERIKVLIAAGAVTRAGVAVRDPATKARAGDGFVVTVPAPEPAHNEAQDIPLVIAFEDEHLLVVDKPAGLVVHPAAGNLDGTLVNALLHHCRGELSGIGGVARPGIVHRIDKDTSGLLVVAKHDRAHEGLAAQFARHSIDRRYKAIVAGVPLRDAGTVDAPLARSPHDRKKMAIVNASHAKRAVTHWRVETKLRDAALLECRLETGRTHQVRVHMASIGHALLGDPAYSRSGGKHAPTLRELGFRRQALHAAVLGYEHPVTRRAMLLQSTIPQDMQALFTALGV
jgi:23S rRNA pseudouridine1911/1915/1917 synthase